MEFLFVVYLLINDVWVRGDEVQGYGSIVYESEAKCLEVKQRAEALQVELKKKNPNAYDKRFECESKPN